MIKKIIVFILIFLCFSLNINAQETDIYKQQLENSGALEIEDSLPDYVKEYLNENSIDISDYNWVNTLTSQNVFSHIWGFLKSGIKGPLIALSSILAVILISALLFQNENSAVNTAVMFATSLATASIVCVPVFSVISASVNAMKGCAVFMSAFIPVFAVIIASSGQVATSVSMSALLLGATNAVSFISNFAVVPLMGGYLSISVASSVSPLLNNNEISSAIKKLSFWIISFVSTVFLGILSVQTAVNASADNLSMRTAKFLIGSSVPVAGGVLSEALNTLTASMSLLKTSVGIYGVVICCLIFLPILIELLLWRFALWITNFISQNFSLGKISGLIEAVDTVLSVLVGIIILNCAMFVLSLTVLVSSGKV